VASAQSARFKIVEMDIGKQEGSVGKRRERRYLDEIMRTHQGSVKRLRTIQEIRNQPKFRESRESIHGQGH
jgi:hypothetical protein